MLIQAIQSVLDQTWPVTEILICDDGSTDDSKAQVLALQKDNTCIRWIDCGRNGRPAIPRNKGIEAAKGEWIAFLDNDDTWARNKNETQLDAAKKSGSSIICANAWRLPSDGYANTVITQVSQGNLAFADLLKVNFIVCSSLLVRKRILQKSNYFPASSRFKAIEDYALWLELALDQSIYFIQDPLVNYLDMPDQSIRSEQVNEFRLRKRILLRTIFLSFTKLKWGKLMLCFFSLIRNECFHFRFYYRVTKRRYTS
jgi:glycosyltransferase involved in cell wall biosynthesis